jgi:hypothetical protein
MSRPTPFELVFEPVASTTFPPIRSALDQARQNPRDRDGFLMLREVLSLVRDLRPEEGLGEGIDQLAALVHHAYLFWAAGSSIVAVSAPQLEALLGDAVRARSDHAELPPCYVQMPEHRVWAEVIPERPPEPLDGCFVYRDADQKNLRVLGIFGIHGDRPGFSVVEAIGSRSLDLARGDGSLLFASTLPGGAAAQLFSLTGVEELLELGWRTYELGAGSSELGGRPSHHSLVTPSS